ncbi:hypothetical protein PIIN_06500 [Serendipita indica DSM 11827]|uniref:Uncharacterized protein n=1 Tax=Serendipita indica (strain DSM 11827) TaxID=1109443 RepID=G4TMM0_SERID|nr:hypothetical protein PIIN_06500 [Serendipita indica DSM 11827]
MEAVLPGWTEQNVVPPFPVDEQGLIFPQLDPAGESTYHRYSSRC